MKFCLILSNIKLISLAYAKLSIFLVRFHISLKVIFDFMVRSSSLCVRTRCESLEISKLLRKENKDGIKTEERTSRFEFCET